MMYSLKKYILLIILLATVSSCDLFRSSGKFPIISTDYPIAKRDTSIRDQYYNVTVRDPYRWMENTSSEPTRQWIQEQRVAFTNYMDAVPFNDPVKTLLNRLWKFDQFTAPFRLGNGLAQFISIDPAQQPVLYQVNEFGETGRVLFNPNVSLAFDDVFFLGWYFSPGGRFAATVIQETGGLWKTIIVIDLETGQRLEDEIIGLQDTRIAWYKTGFYYTKYDENKSNGLSNAPDYFHQVYYHQLGSLARSDELIFRDLSEPTQVIEPFISNNKDYLLLHCRSARTGVRLLAKNFNRNSVFEEILSIKEGDLNFVGELNNNFYVITNDQAPNGHLIRTAQANLGKDSWEIIIPESGDILEKVNLTNNRIVAVYYKDGAQNIKIFDLQGRLQHRLELPEPGSVDDMSMDRTAEIGYLSFSSFLQTPRIYELDVSDGAMEIYKSSFSDFAYEQYRVNKVRYPSLDGEPVAMYILRARGSTLSPQTPTLLIGSGSKHDDISPRYNPTGLQLVPAFLELGGQVAIPIIRGSGRDGSYWHKMGIRQDRQKAFDDFQAAADYLIQNGYTRSDKLAAYGQGPVAGALVAGCMIQHPDLFKVVVSREGIYDFLRYQHFNNAWKFADEIGWAENRADFNPLWAIDPRRNAISTQYPAVLLVSSITNREVAPVHAYKLAAELQVRQKGRSPVLMKLDNAVYDRMIHPAELTIDEASAILAFMLYQLEYNPFLSPENVQ